MSIHTTKKEIQSKETKEQILNVASALFKQYGPFKVSMRDIASAANVTTGALYHHFSSKEALLTTIGIDMKSNIERILQTVDKDGSIIEQLIEFVSKFVSHEIEINGKEINQYRLKNRSAVNIGKNTTINPLPTTIMSYITDAQKHGMLDNNWEPSEITKCILMEMWTVHYDYAMSKKTINISEALSKRIPLVLRAFIPGTYEKRDWWKA